MKVINRNTNSTKIRNSRYVQGGDTDKYKIKLGWWERKIFDKYDNDLITTISPKENKRPDLIAKRIYNNVNLGCLILQYNNIVDIETELTTGVEIRLPTPRRVSLDILTKEN
jgi:hypothetical protein